jgi:hypothetical protein
MTDPDCLLCTAERLTDWFHEDDDCWVAECIVCRTPMVVWRIHGLPDGRVEAPMIAHLERVAAERYGDDGFYLDRDRRRIPDHWHVHARPAGGFFDPASDLYGKYETGQWAASDKSVSKPGSSKAETARSQRSVAHPQKS